MYIKSSFTLKITLTRQGKAAVILILAPLRLWDENGYWSWLVRVTFSSPGLSPDDCMLQYIFSLRLHGLIWCLLQKQVFGLQTMGKYDIFCIYRSLSWLRGFCYHKVQSHCLVIAFYCGSNIKDFISPLCPEVRRNRYQYFFLSPVDHLQTWATVKSTNIISLIFFLTVDF